METCDDIDSSGMATLRFKQAKEYFEHIAKEKLPSKETTVLLIGSTGNGKSTLGNYLLAMGANDESERFATAKDNKPQTQNVQSDKIAITDPALKYSSVHITVIDTPGLELAFLWLSLMPRLIPNTKKQLNIIPNFCLHFLRRMFLLS